MIQGSTRPVSTPALALGLSFWLVGAEKSSRTSLVLFLNLVLLRQEISFPKPCSSFPVGIEEVERFSILFF